MDENRENVRRLTLAMSRMDGASYYFARKSGLKENLLTLLYALDDGKPHSQKEVCEDWLIPKTTINTIVRELVTQGHVTLLSSEGTLAAYAEAVRQKYRFFSFGDAMLLL